MGGSTVEPPGDCLKMILRRLFVHETRELSLKIDMDCVIMHLLLSLHIFYISL